MILSRLDKWIVAGFGVVAILGMAAWIGPHVLVEHGRREAMACLDDSQAPVDGARCDVAEVDLARLASVSWVKHDATYSYEELRARRALAAYDAAAVLAPSAAGLKPAADWVAREEEVIRQGSERLTMDELGTAVGAPDVAAAALARGDRATLRERYDHIGLWSLRLAALNAALLDGETELAEKIAARYAEFDPRDADLRSAVGAALCLGPDPGRGLEILARIPNDRADKRYAAIARGYGELRVAQEACADLAGIEASPLPTDRHAGTPDATEALAVQALRLAKGEVETREAQAAVRSLLDGEAAPTGPGLDPTVLLARIALLGELLASDPSISAADLVELARQRTPSEPPLLPTAPIGASAVLDDPRGKAPYVAPKTYVQAAARVRALLEKTELAQARGAELEDVARAFEVQAALGFARGGESEAAIDAATRSVGADKANNVTRTLSRSVAVASGSFEAALAIDKVADGKARRPSFDFEVMFDMPVTDVTRVHLMKLATAEASTEGGAADPLLHAIQGTEAERRQARRAVIASRGSAPSELALYAIVVGRLAPQGAAEPDVETWLDAALAIDAPRFSMRQIAFARVVAARSRGHEASAQSWERKLATLRAPFADPRKAVIARFLGM